MKSVFKYLAALGIAAGMIPLSGCHWAELPAPPAPPGLPQPPDPVVPVP